MPYQDEALNQLIINKLSQERYNELSAAGEVSANQLYFIESEGTIDAASGIIENVADPINNTDAANKQYVDSFTTNSLSSYTTLTTSNNISSLLNTDITYVSSQVSGIPSDITYVSSSLSSYTPLTISNNISSALNNDITYVSGQVSGIPDVITNLSSNVSSNYLLKTDIPTAEDLGLSNYAPLSTVTNLNNSLSSVYSTKSDVTYVSSQVSGIPLTITGLSSTVSSNYATASFVTDLSNSLSSYALSSDVNSISSALNSDILDVSNSLSSYTTLTTSNDISSLLKSDITYVSSQVSGIPSTITSLSSTVSSNYALSSDVTSYVDQQIGNINAILETI